MNDFTFVMITYNQEQYVIQHFKSIIYQIKNYGSNIRNNIIIADDCSNDNTITILKKLIDEYRTYIHSFTIIVQDHNVGIVNNHISALKAIKTEYFKILAGDDLYFKNNVYKEIEGKCFNICPTIMFDENKSWFANELFHKSLILRQKNNEKLTHFLESNLRIHITPFAPSVFYNKSVITSGLIEYLANYHWIEDLPSYDYIYRNIKPPITISIKPLTLYRINSGISTKKNHIKNDVFEKEKTIINNNICRRYKKNKYLNPFHYYKTLNNYIDRIKSSNSSDINLLLEELSNVNNEVKDYFEQLEKI